MPAKSKPVDPPARTSRRGRGRLARTSSDLSASDDEDGDKKCR